MHMHETRTLGAARLELFALMKNQFAFSDFCVPAGTITFEAHDGFLKNRLRLFKLSYPEYELEASVCDGMVFVRRNGFHQHSVQYLGNDPRHVVIQWEADSIACGTLPKGSSEEEINQNMRAVQTPFTFPPMELVRLLRTENLLENSAYRSSDDLFATVLDCLHLCERDIRRHGGERFIWGKNGDSSKPLDEPEISRFVASFLSALGAARNFDVTCESIAGGGHVDFHIVAPVAGAGMAKVAIEAKKAESTKLSHGLQVQLPEYMARIGTPHGIYLTYWLKSSDYPHPSQNDYVQLEIEVLHPIQRLPTVRTVGMDLSLGPTPSKRNA